MKWYANGLRFSCTQCGHCCTGGADGFVFVGPNECKEIADFLGIAYDRFVAEYTEPWLDGKTRTTLKLVRPTSASGPAAETGASRQCVFLDGRKCKIYPVAPPQCKSWPFWPLNVDERESWTRTRTRCPGAGTGRLFSASEVTNFTEAAFLV